MQKYLGLQKGASFYYYLGKGYMGYIEALRNYKHFGMEKRYILDNRTNYNYDQTLLYLYRCINAGRLIDVDQLKSKLNNLKNR